VDYLFPSFRRIGCRNPFLNNYWSPFMIHAYEKPSLLARYQSSFIDLLVLLTALVILSMTIDALGDVPDWVRASLVGAMLLYEPVLTAYGCTVGQKLMRIRVRDVNSMYGTGPEKPLNLPMAIWRFFMKSMMGWLSFITIHSNADRRAIHDFAAGSVMIRY
jgi:uncharacterized RDD family membrane protein YckC